MDTTIKYVLPIYLVIYFATAFLGRSFLIWKRTGINPYTLGNADNAHDFVGLLFRLVLVACIIVVGVYALWPAGYQYLIPIFWLQHTSVIVLGLGLLVISLVWTLIAQAQMGKSWRIGIDVEHRTELVQTGIFRLSRNPIFLGMRLTLLGLFCLLPNAVTLAILAVGEVLLQIQVRLEEEYLAKIHGEDYWQYRRQTQRWL
jgi:protein-S-isoprenylcysteine O-methyltransferase Ste14